MSPRTGRPISEDGRKDKLLQVRLDKRSLQTLDKCAKELETTRSTAVREGISVLAKRLGIKE